MNIGMRNLLLSNILVTLCIGLITFIVYEKGNSILAISSDPAKISKLSQALIDCADIEELRKKANLLLEVFVASEAGKKVILRSSFLYFSFVFVMAFIASNLYLIYLIKKAPHS